MYFIMIFKSAFLQWTDAEKKILKFTAPCHEDNFLNETAHTHTKMWTNETGKKEMAKRIKNPSSFANWRQEKCQNRP